MEDSAKRKRDLRSLVEVRDEGSLAGSSSGAGRSGPGNQTGRGLFLTVLLNKDLSARSVSSGI
jgi:hypothetical protein